MDFEKAKQELTTFGDWLKSNDFKFIKIEFEKMQELFVFDFEVRKADKGDYLVHLSTIQPINTLEELRTQVKQLKSKIIETFTTKHEIINLN